jgi:hypothetical protein
MLGLVLTDLDGQRLTARTRRSGISFFYFLPSPTTHDYFPTARLATQVIERLSV